MNIDCPPSSPAGADSAPAPEKSAEAPTLPPHTVLSQREFLARFGPALTERVASACPPVYRGPTDAPWAPLTLLKRKPLGAQGLIAQAGACAIRGLRAHREHGQSGPPLERLGRPRRRGVGLVAEMATGKSLLSLAILGLADEEVTRQQAPANVRPQKARFFPALVLCPPIVAAKWVREAAHTLPTARPVVIRPLRTRAEVAAFRHFDPTFSGKQLSAIGCAERVIARIQAELAAWQTQRDKALREGRTPPRKPCHVAILSTSTAKLGPAWTPVYLLRALRDVDEHSAVSLLRDPATGEPIVVPCCPRCFEPLQDETRAERAERERRKRSKQRRGGVTEQPVALGASGAGGAGDEVGDEEILSTYLLEAELLGTPGCPRTKRTCSSCGEPLWQVVPDNVRWQATPPPLHSGGVGRPVRRLPIPDRDHHPPCLTSTLERRYPLADYLRKRHRGVFRSLICDEAHQFKGAGTAQGFAAASLVDACDPGGTTLFLTGTLFSGYASDLYPMLWRLLPELRQTFHYGDLKRWVDLYGVRQKVVKVREGRAGRREDGAVSKRREDHPLIKELPGISPLVLRHLLDSCLFLELADVAPGLPPYSEEVVVVRLGEPLGPVYERFERESTAALKELLVHEDHSGLAAWFQGLMIQPNLPWRGFTAVSSHGEVLGQAEPLPADLVYPKEWALLNLVRRERAEERRVLVYAEHTQAYDLLPRLKALLEADDAAWREEWAQRTQSTRDVLGAAAAERAEHNADASGERDAFDQSGKSDEQAERLVVQSPPRQPIRVALLRSATVASGEREAWLRRTVEQGCDVLICHSGLVEVGLDLLDFPTIVCYETIFSTCRARQATRRSYRPGQTQPVKVVQLVYDRAMEARGLQLIASKIKSSLMVEGKLPGEGLATFGQSSDDQGNLLLELARSVLADEEGGARDVAGSLEATFRELAQAEHEQDGYIGGVEMPSTEDALVDTAAARQEDAEVTAAMALQPREAGLVTADSGEGLVGPEPSTHPAGSAEISASPSSPSPTHVSGDDEQARDGARDAPWDPWDPWARWRELARRAQSTRARGRRPGSHSRRITEPPPAQDGSLWAAPAVRPSSPPPDGFSPEAASTTGDDQFIQAVQPTLWANQ